MDINKIKWGDFYYIRGDGGPKAVVKITSGGSFSSKHAPWVWHGYFLWHEDSSKNGQALVAGVTDNWEKIEVKRGDWIHRVTGKKTLVTYVNCDYVYQDNVQWTHEYFLERFRNINWEGIEDEEELGNACKGCGEFNPWVSDSDFECWGCKNGY